MFTYFCNEIFFLMRLIYILLSVCILVFTSCGNTEHNNSSNTAEASKASKGSVQSKLDGNSTRYLMAAVAKYYGLKNAFVATKAADVNASATSLAEMADTLQTLLQKDTTNYTTLKPYIDTISAQSKMITAIKDESCEKQRL